MNNIETLSPQAVWENFELICSIPHPSKHEKALGEEIIRKAQSLGLEHIVDATGNIIVRKPAHPDAVSKAEVALQAHIDMVPQKNSATQHDFLKDPIKPYIDGEWVTATDTTLGADNGIGAATMLALMESADIQHGPLEFLFTVDEEAGMGGAFGLEPGILQSKYLINLDSEDDKEIIIGCAGGIDATITEKINKKASPIIDAVSFKISIKGLKGGHSGIDINLGRGNANIILARICIDLLKNQSAELIEFDGGNMRNAIPREAVATMLISQSNLTRLEKKIDDLEQDLRNEYQTTDPDIQLSLTAVNNGANCKIFAKSEAIDFCSSVAEAPNGVISTEPDFPDVVMTSTNLSIAQINDKGVTICLLLRSSSDDSKTNLVIDLREHFSGFSYNAEFHGEYPGWEPVPDSPLLSKLKASYKAIMQSAPEVKIIHAGLECGIIGSKYPEMQMVSFGPTIKHPHSPDEKVNIVSVEKFWNVIIDVLEKI